jgi:hypothetical protein
MYINPDYSFFLDGGRLEPALSEAEGMGVWEPGGRLVDNQKALAVEAKD